MGRFLKPLFAGLLAATIALSADAAQIMYRGTSGKVLTNAAPPAARTFTIDPIGEVRWMVGERVNFMPVVRSVATGEVLTPPNIGMTLIGTLPLGVTFNRQTGFQGVASQLAPLVPKTIQITDGVTRLAVTFNLMVVPTVGISIDPRTTSNLSVALKGTQNTRLLANPPTFVNAVAPITFEKVSGPFVVDPKVGKIYSTAVETYRPLSEKFVSGTYTARVRVTDASGRSLEYDHNITINSLNLTVSNLTIAANTNYVGKTPAPTGATGGYRFIYAGLPAGLNYDETTGVISGKIAKAQSGQTYPVSVILEAVGSGETLTKNFTITVPAIGHRYWRWYPQTWTKTGAGAVAGFQFSELRLIDDEGVRIFAPGLVSTSAAGVGGNPLSNAFDGSNSTFWEVGIANGTTSGSMLANRFAFTMAFDTPKEIKSIEMVARGGSLPQVATAWVVYYSDKSITGPWTVAWTDANSQAAFATNPTYVSRKK